MAFTACTCGLVSGFQWAEFLSQTLWILFVISYTYHIYRHRLFAGSYAVCANICGHDEQQIFSLNLNSQWWQQGVPQVFIYSFRHCLIARLTRRDREKKQGGSKGNIHSYDIQKQRRLMVLIALTLGITLKFNLNEYKTVKERCRL